MNSILSWIQTGSSGNYNIPALIFTPTLSTLTMINNLSTKNSVKVRIKNTGLYDGIHNASIDKMTNLHCCPPNLNYESPKYVLFLHNKHFQGMPKNLGQFDILLT